MDGKTLDTTNSDGSLVISVAEIETPNTQKQQQQKQPPWGCCYIHFPRIGETRWLIHGVKVGLALVLVSLLYMLEAVHDRLGDNAMWAVMTVVVVFEFTVGATINKGLNRGAGTILGGGLGYLVVLLAQEIGGVGKAVAIGTSVFVAGAAATYFRMVPRIKKKYDYGALIFILTFSLVAVSGVRVDEIIKIASDRLSSISMGFVICVFISLSIFPVWAGDELHRSLASKFDILAGSIDECLEDYIKPLDEKIATQSGRSHCCCSSVLSSKSTDEAMANFAKWEPWHGRFGFYYPWNKYLRIGELLRELTASLLSLKGFLRSKRQPSPLCLTMGVKERCEATCTLLGCTMRELGEIIDGMKQCQHRETILADFQTMRADLCSSSILVPTPATVMNQNGMMGGGIFVTSIVSLLVEVLDKVEELVKEVDELGKVAKFR